MSIILSKQAVYEQTEEKWCDPCISPGDNCCLVDLQGSGIDKKFSSQYWSTYLNLDKYRIFRENFLKSNQYGRKFLHYYKALSEFLSTNKSWDVGTKVYTAKYLPELCRIVTLLNNSEMGSKEIIIREEDRTKFIEVLEKYKKLSSSNDYQSVIKDLENDINNFAGKNKSELVSYLNSVND